MKVLIPTMLDMEQLAPQIAEIRAASPGVEIIASCLKASASANRNACLRSLNLGEFAVMLDDDISGFYPGWIDDLIYSLRMDRDVVMVSARLLNEDGTFGPTCSRIMDPKPEEIEVKNKWPCVLPTAAIAFRDRGYLYDENFAGSGFEDNDYCMQILQDHPSAKFIQSNRCRLIHANLMREQKGPNWIHNKKYFFEKWQKCPA